MTVIILPWFEQIAGAAQGNYLGDNTIYCIAVIGDERVLQRVAVTVTKRIICSRVLRRKGGLPPSLTV